MRRFPIALLAAVLVAQVGVARAASIDFAASELRGNSVVVTNLGPSLLAIDPDFVSDAPIDLIVVLDAQDLGAPLAWNALVDNLTGEVWQAFSVEVFGAISMHVGSALANAGAIAWIDATWATAALHFDPAEAAGIDLGAPFGVGEDWRVDLGDGSTTSFRLRFAPLAVPEPSALLAIGGGLVALARIRRRAGDCVQH
jgi:hypothetical protein